MSKAKKILIAIIVFSLIWLFTSVIYIQLMPDVGGMTYETQPIFWMLVFIAGEIAVCTYLIVSALKGALIKDGNDPNNRK